MAVSAEYRAWVLEQMGRVAPVSARSMFGGAGVYSEGIFFALLSDDGTYLKVDDTNRGDFEAAGMGPFRPYGDSGGSMQYYELPPEVLEDPERLRPWMERALEVARRKRSKAR